MKTSLQVLLTQLHTIYEKMRFFLRAEFFPSTVCVTRMSMRRRERETRKRRRGCDGYRGGDDDGGGDADDNDFFYLFILFQLRLAPMTTTTTTTTSTASSSRSVLDDSPTTTMMPSLYSAPSPGLDALENDSMQWPLSIQGDHAKETGD